MAGLSSHAGVIASVKGVDNVIVTGVSLVRQQRVMSAALRTSVRPLTSVPPRGSLLFRPSPVIPATVFPSPFLALIGGGGGS
jgi:hypothetical protein